MGSSSDEPKDDFVQLAALGDSDDSEDGEESLLVNLDGRRGFTHDTYGAFYVALLRFLHERINCVKVMAVITCGFWHFTLMAVQLLSMWLMLAFAVERIKDRYDTAPNGLGGDTQLLLTAVATNKSLNTTQPDQKTVVDLCMSDHYVPWSEILFLWIWSMKLMPMLSASGMNMAITQRMTTHASAWKDFTPNDPKDPARKVIAYVRPCAKVACNLSINLPRIAISVYLFWTGAKFLCFADTLGTMVLKCIGLVFIATIPEIFFVGALSDRVQKDTTQVSLAFKQIMWLPNAEEYTHWNTWISSLLKLVNTLGVSLIIARVRFGHVFAFRGACEAYKYQFVVPTCAPQCGSNYFGHEFYY